MLVTNKIYISRNNLVTFVLYQNCYKQCAGIHIYLTTGVVKLMVRNSQKFTLVKASALEICVKRFIAQVYFKTILTHRACGTYMYTCFWVCEDVTYVNICTYSAHNIHIVKMLPLRPVTVNRLRLSAAYYRRPQWWQLRAGNKYCPGQCVHYHHCNYNNNNGANYHPNGYDHHYSSFI